MNFCKKAFFFLTILALSLSSCISCISSYLTVTYPTKKIWPSLVLVSSIPKDEEGRFIATGWAIDNNYIITAGHFCEKIKETSLLGTSEEDVFLTRVNKQGEDIILGKAGIVAFVSKDIEDVCLLYFRNHGIKPLEIQKDLSLVQTEDRVTISGAPRGGFPIRRDGYVWVVSDRILLAIEVQMGNSGSPVLWHGKVIGMVIHTLAPTGISNAGVAMRSDDILTFISKFKE